MSEQKKPVDIGGQAVLEGVMMKGPEAIAIAVRRENGDIVVHFLDDVCGVQPVHVGHTDVHQYQVRILCQCFLYGLNAILGTEDLETVLQDVLHQHIVAVIVFCYKYTFHSDMV